MPQEENRVLIAFIPVLHVGYIELLKKHGGTLYILGSDIIVDFTALTRDARTVDPQIMKSAIEALGLCDSIEIITKAQLPRLAEMQIDITMPAEEVSYALQETYFPNKKVQFENVFLRWHQQLSTQEHIVSPTRVISENDAHRELMQEAANESAKSADWWRQIGVVFVKDGTIIAQAHNHHLPSDFHLAINGDPRSSVDAGTHPELYTSIHAEASAIAAAAKEGISLKGSSLFTTTFPCPNCARLIAEAGVKTVYYRDGYSRLDAEDILKAFGIGIVLVR